MLKRLKKGSSSISDEIEKRASCADEKLQCAVQLLSDTIDRMAPPPQKMDGLAAFRLANVRHA